MSDLGLFNAGLSAVVGRNLVYIPQTTGSGYSVHHLLLKTRKRCVVSTEYRPVNGDYGSYATIHLERYLTTGSCPSLPGTCTPFIIDEIAPNMISNSLMSKMMVSHT